MGTADDERDDPLEGLRLDESFVRMAAAHEPSAEDRVRRARSEVAQQEAEDERIAMLRQAHRATRRAERRSRFVSRVKTFGVVGLVVGFAGWYVYAELDGDDQAAAPEWSSAAAESAAAAGLRPTPAAAQTPVRLASQPDPPSDETGPFRFISTQPGTDAPVTYDPCRVIHVVINERTMPEGAAGLVEDTLEEVGHLTGLAFEVEGRTDEAPVKDRPNFQPERYGDRWAPVLIAWSDQDEDVRLLGDSAGVAGSAFVESEPGHWVYVTGDVTIDGEDMAEILEHPSGDGKLYASDIIRHELGHLVGLDHVDDDSEVMFPQGRPDKVGFNAGDRWGLAAVGGGRCVGEL